MSGRWINPKQCGMCDRNAVENNNGVQLCLEHAAVANRLDKLRAAQTDPSVDLTGRMSHGPRDGFKGGYKRRFDVVPDDTIERVARDVTISVDGIPIWAAETLFQRIHLELGKPDIDNWSASITVKYSGLDEDQYQKLSDLDNKLWVGISSEVTETRIYPSLRAAAEELRNETAE